VKGKLNYHKEGQILDRWKEDEIGYLKRLRWAAHVMRMENTRTTRKITEWTPYEKRPAGRPRLRWMDQIEEDLKRMKHWLKGEGRGQTGME